MSAGDGTASSACLQASGPPGVSSCTLLCIASQPQRQPPGTSGASSGALCEANGLATPTKAASDRSPNCLCKKIQPGRPCKLTQGAGRKSSALQRLVWANLSAAGRNQVANVCLDQCQDHGGTLPQCMPKVGLVHPFLDRSILAPKSPPWLLDPKAGVGSAVVFWPQSPL